MTTSAGTARRRKIFPHLDDEKRPVAASEVPGDANHGNDVKKEDGGGATTDDKTSYNNAKSKKGSARKKTDKNHVIPNASTSQAVQHLLPLPLVLTVLVCSGLFWIASFRDVMATGKPMLDTLSILWGQNDADANFLVSPPEYMVWR